MITDELMIGIVAALLVQGILQHLITTRAIARQIQELKVEMALVKKDIEYLRQAK